VYDDPWFWKCSASRIPKPQGKVTTPYIDGVCDTNDPTGKKIEDGEENDKGDDNRSDNRGDKGDDNRSDNRGDKGDDNRSDKGDDNRSDNRGDKGDDNRSDNRGDKRDNTGNDNRGDNKGNDNRGDKGNDNRGDKGDDGETRWRQVNKTRGKKNRRRENSAGKPLRKVLAPAIRETD